MVSRKRGENKTSNAYAAVSALLFASNCPSMANKVGDDHPDDDGQRGGEGDRQNYDPHASRSIIKAIKFAQHDDIKAL